MFETFLGVGPNVKIEGVLGQNTVTNIDLADEGV